MTAAGPWTNHGDRGKVAFWLAKPKSPAHYWLEVRQPKPYARYSDAWFQPEGRGHCSDPWSQISHFSAFPCFCPKAGSVDMRLWVYWQENPWIHKWTHDKSHAKAELHESILFIHFFKNLFSTRYPPKKMSSQENGIPKIDWSSLSNALSYILSFWPLLLFKVTMASVFLPPVLISVIWLAVATGPSW